MRGGVDSRTAYRYGRITPESRDTFFHSRSTMMDASSKILAGSFPRCVFLVAILSICEFNAAGAAPPAASLRAGAAAVDISPREFPVNMPGGFSQNLVGLLPCSLASGEDLVLAGDGKADYQIVVPDAPATAAIGECLRQVARLMQTAFHAQGFELSIVAEGQRDPAKSGIYLGDTAFARTNGVDVAKLKDWGYIHKVVGRDVIIAGRDHPAPRESEGPRRPVFDRVGTAKGAADFLRQYVGTRFLYPDIPLRASLQAAAEIDLLTSPAIEFIPTPTVAIPGNLDVRQTVPLKYNIAWGSGAGFYDLANNRFPIVDEVFGGHTYQRAVPLDKYAETHPEYFALIDGKRLVDPTVNAQYCISNAEVQRLMYEDLIGWLDKGCETVDLGQPDGFRPCQCDACRELFDTGDDWSEKLWILHRRLAEQVLAARPGKQVTMMSYILTALPPKTFTQFPENTRIMLTGTNEEDIAPWRACTVPGGFTSYVYNWCPNLGSRYTPMRTPRFVESQVKRLVDNRIQSVYRDGPGALYGLEGPVYYTMGRMFDDAENNRAQDLVNEFCGAAFGKASSPMLRFYERLYHGIELYSEFLGTRCPAWAYHDISGRRRKYLTDPFQLLGFLYTPSLLDSLEEYLALAERLGDTDKVKTRLALVRREFDYLKSLARVVHLYHAYQLQPDRGSRNRLLDAIDARNAAVADYYGERGRTKPLAGWAYTMFPIPGHSEEHLRLAYDGYQEPYKSTCLNWDTSAMRNAPLPGAKRMTVPPAANPVALDSPQWQRAASHELAPLLTGVEVTRKTTVQTLYDNASLYVRVEGALASDRMNDSSDAELVELCVAPSAGRDIVYRFRIGPKAESKSDAALGFVSDVMDPRYGQFDPDWTGEWTVETRLEPEKNRWLALLSIPFKTLGVERPAPGTTWRGNFGRVHVCAPDRNELSLWSVTAGVSSLDDPDAFGELVFDGAAHSEAPGQEARK